MEFLQKGQHRDNRLKRGIDVGGRLEKRREPPVLFAKGEKVRVGNEEQRTPEDSIDAEFVIGPFDSTQGRPDRPYLLAAVEGLGPDQHVFDIAGL